MARRSPLFVYAPQGWTIHLYLHVFKATHCIERVCDVVLVSFAALKLTAIAKPSAVALRSCAAH